MENNIDIYEIVKHNPLWDGIGRDDFENMIHCMDARTKKYGRGSVVLLTGNPVSKIGLIITGSLMIIKEDVNGNDTILAELGVSELFGEVFACAGIDHSPVTVQAIEKSEILFFDYRKVITSCPSSCIFHSRLIENMIRILAQKNLLLNQKIEILSKRTTREKLLTFLETFRGASNKFTVPYNREEMSRYLCVDRSAMSGELCRMRDEGLIKFNKNEFEIL